MPSLALRIATLVPRICAFMRSAIARPAASSFAELTRRPDDRRCIEVASDDCEVLRLRCALSEVMLVLMVCGMRALLAGTKASGNDAGIVRAVVSACAQFLSPRFGRGPAKRDAPTRQFVAQRKSRPGGRLRAAALAAPAFSAAASAPVCGSWLACATIALPACCRICARDRLAVSAAKSASMIRPRAADWFSPVIDRFEIAMPKRLIAAP